MKRRQFLARSASLFALTAQPGKVFAQSFAASLPAQITDLGATELSLAIRMKLLSCEEVMAAYLKHIHRYNPTYNAIVALQEDDLLLEAARTADQELAQHIYHGWMHGMPHAIKDLEAVKGLPVSYGSPLFEDYIAEADDPLPASIRRAGAIFIGKTNTPEFGLGSQSYNPVYGSTGSAWNPDLTAGGSSGGAASGLGTHMLPVADGSDMMGSLRNPGAFNNVIGFRPSAGLMGSGNAFTRDLATVGPMGRNTRDTVRLLNTIMPKPGLDAPQALWSAAENVAAPARLRFKDLKLAWLGDFDGYLAMESGVLPLCESALSKVSDAGATIEKVTPRFDMADLWDCWLTLRNLSRVGMREWYEDPEKRPLLKPELQWEIEQSYTLSAEDISRAKATRSRWYTELQRLFEAYDFILLPSAQVFPFDKNVHWPTTVGGRTMDTYHRWMEVVIPGSIPGLPVANLPAGFDSQRRPMGIQVMGPYGDDAKVLGFAAAYEGITDFLAQRPVLVERS
ncbi:amidase [Congregibacter sp.]|uniref:amidase n=1 Tax=Congregibacter sp. TaxID=2744308 RepID=UPI003F6BC6DE